MQVVIRASNQHLFNEHGMVGSGSDDSALLLVFFVPASESIDNEESSGSVETVNCLGSITLVSFGF